MICGLADYFFAMIMKKDIGSREDITTFMERFYGKALTDNVIGFFFTEVVKLNMQTHLPVIVDFWETVLFGVAKYKGNAMQVHQHIHQLSAFTEEHFERWLALFTQTVDELFEGDRAELAKQRAVSIATMMKLKTIYKGKQIN